MTLKERAGRALAALPPVQDPPPLVAQEGALRLVCHLATLDALACAVDRLVVETSALANAGPERLKQLAEQLSGRLTYLLEPISPIEVDPQQCAVQMRSSPPQQEEHGKSYYELLIRRGGEASLCRYSHPRGQPRQPIPAQLTREVLLRLVDDFAAVLG